MKIKKKLCTIGKILIFGVYYWEDFRFTSICEWLCAVRASRLLPLCVAFLILF